MNDQGSEMSIPAFDQLEDEFRRVGRAENRARPHRRKLVVAVVGVALAVATPAVAVAVISDGDEPGDNVPPGPEEAFSVPAPGSPEALQDAAELGITLEDLKPENPAGPSSAPIDRRPHNRE